MTYYMYFVQTLIIRCTVCKILAEIDHKSPNWTFLTLKMTFRVIPYLSYCRTELVSQQRSNASAFSILCKCLHGMQYTKRKRLHDT